MTILFWVETTNADKIVKLVNQFGEPHVMLLEKSVEWPHLKPSVTEKRRNKAKYLTWNSINLWIRPAWQKALDISSATARVVLDMLKVLAILSDTTVRRSTVDQGNLKPYWKSEKRSHFSRWSEILLFTRFSKTFLTTERRLTGW